MKINISGKWVHTVEKLILEKPSFSIISLLKRTWSSWRHRFRLSSPSTICLEDITSDDEIYSVQCPKEFDIESLLGKKISLTGESMFEGRTNGEVDQPFESFTVNVKSKINLLLPSKQTATYKLGGFPVAGNIIVSKRCELPEVDESSFSCRDAESSDEGSGSSNFSIPLPSGLKVRHPLHGLNYKNHPTPNFKAVISKEKKSKKHKNKHRNDDGKGNEFKKPMALPRVDNDLSSSEISSHNQEDTVRRNQMDVDKDEELISPRKHKKKKKIRRDDDETDVGFKKPIVPPISSDADSFTPLRDGREKDTSSVRGVVIGRNLISLDSEDESHRTPIKHKKRNKEDLIEKLLQAEMQTTRIKEETPDDISKKKKKKKIKTDEILEDLNQGNQTSSNKDDVIHISEKHKKKKKSRKDGNDGADDEFKKPIAPRDNSDDDTINTHKGGGNVRGIVIGRNLISLDTEDESTHSSIKHKKKKKNTDEELIGKLLQLELQGQIEARETDEVSNDSNKKKKKRKKIEEPLEELNQEEAVHGDKKKKKEKRKEKKSPE